MVKLTPGKKPAIVLMPKRTEAVKKPVSVIKTAKISLAPASAAKVTLVPAQKAKSIISRPSISNEQGKAIVRPAKGFRVRVSNIAYEVKQEDIRISFALIGKVLSCSLKDGTAIVTFDRKEDASAAIEKYHQGDIHGRKLYVDFD